MPGHITHFAFERGRSDDAGRLSRAGYVPQTVFAGFAGTRTVGLPDRVRRHKKLLLLGILLRPVSL